MVHGAVRWLFRGLAALALLLLVAAALLALRLSQGPLPLDPLLPYVLDQINRPDAPVRIDIGRADLRWGDWSHPFDLRAGDVAARTRDGALVAAVPEASLTVEPGPLLREGRLELGAVTLRGAVVNLRRERDGAITLAVSGATGTDTDTDTGTRTGDAPAQTVEHRAEGLPQALRAVMRDLGVSPPAEGDSGAAAPPEAPPPVTLPQAVRLADARVTIDDAVTGITWRFPTVDGIVTRSGGRLEAEASVTLASPTGGTTTLDAVATLERGLVDAGLSFRDVRPADFATVAEVTAPLAGLDLPLSGTVTATLGVEADAVRLALLGVSLTGGPGVVAAPEPVSHAWSLDGLEVRLSAADDLSQVALERLAVDFQGDAAVVARAALDTTAGGVGISVEATATDVGVDVLPELWPAGVEPKVRTWIDSRLDGGMISRFTARAGLAGPSLEALELVDLSGDGAVAGTTVDYMPPMPKVQGAVATLTVAPDAVRLAIQDGALDDLRVTGGRVDFRDLDVSPQVADIDLIIQGPLRDALRVVDSEPLGYVSRFGLPIDGVRGQQTTRLTLSFPLLDALQLDDVEVRAESTVRDAVLPDAAFDQTLSDGDLSLVVDKAGMQVSGTAALADVPATVQWEERFVDSPKDFRSRYEATAVIDAAGRARLDLDLVPLSEPFLSGPVAASVILTELPDGQRTLGATLDLEPAAMELPGFGWTKAPGAPGTASISALMGEGGSVRDIPRFSVEAPDLRLRGSIGFALDGPLDRMTLDGGRIGATVLAGTALARADGGFDVDVSGPLLDAEPFFGGEDDPAEAPAAPPEGAEDDTGPDLPPLSLRGRFDTVRFGEDAALQDVVAHVMRDADAWTYADVSGLAEGTAPVAFQFAPVTPNALERRFTLTSADAGTVLRALGLLGTVRGGVLEVRGSIDAADITEGQAEIRDFRLVEAPLLARVLSVAALTGILEGLTGDGLAFTAATAPFTYDGALLRLRDARVHGPSLGLTAQGTVSLDGADTVDLEGTVVPAYALNSLLGNLPVVGDLITGGEKGGGLFAATYAVKGPLEAPAVTVNPLSVLAPGFLRKLFDAPEPQPGPPPQATPQPVAPAPAPAPAPVAPAPEPPLPPAMQ